MWTSGRLCQGVIATSAICCAPHSSVALSPLCALCQAAEPFHASVFPSVDHGRGLVSVVELMSGLAVVLDMSQVSMIAGFYRRPQVAMGHMPSSAY